MLPLNDDGDDFYERYFKNASRSQTPWGIARNWLLILRMLTALTGSWLWQSLKCYASIPKTVAALLFSRRVRQQLHLYKTAHEAGSTDTDQRLQELETEVQTALGVQRPPS